MTATQAPPHSRTSRWVALFLIAVAAIGGALYVSGAFRPTPKLAIVTASQGPYWDQIIRGAQDAADSSKAAVTIVRCTGDEASQTRDIQALIGQGYDGIAVSPNNPLEQAAVLADVGDQCT